MVAHRLPFPPNKGDKIRAFHVLTHLAERHEVLLACLVDDADDLKHVESLRSRVADLAIARIDGRARRFMSACILVRLCLRSFPKRTRAIRTRSSFLPA
jgi:hypothetical protein